MAVPHSTKEDYKAMIFVWPFIGLRVAELMGLSWADVDLSGQRIRVTKQWKGPGHVEPVLKTNHAERTVYLTKACVRVLRRWRLVSHGEFVFPAKDGARCTRGTCRDALLAAAKRAKIEGLAPHDMGHSFASWLIAAGVDIREVAERLGHRDPGFTLRTYGHLVRENDDSARKLEVWAASAPNGFGVAAE